MSTNRSRIVGSTQLRNKVNRNAFDLSHRHMYTAQIGELLPVTCQWLNPGEKAQFGYQGFTRTTPLQTAAFTRLRENIQFFFVPFQSLWKYFNTQMNNMTKGKDGQDISMFAKSAYETESITTSMPYLNYNDLQIRLQGIITQMVNTIFTKEIMQFAKNSKLGFVEWYKVAFSSRRTRTFLGNNAPQAIFTTLAYNYFDEFGSYRYVKNAKLLQSLGYGNFIFYQTYDLVSNVYAYMLKEHPDFDVDLPVMPFISSEYGFAQDWNYRGISNPPNLSLFPLLAYQHIYYDFYLNKDWQERHAELYNIDYILPTSAMNFVSYRPYTEYTNKIKYNSPSIFDLQQSNLPLDYLNGVLPSAQFSTESSVSLGDQGTVSTSQTVGQRYIATASQSSDSVVNLDVSDKTFRTNSNNVIDITVPHTHNVNLGDASFSISSLRNALALQKYKEIQNSNDTDFESQVLALFGVKPRKGCDVMYLNGADSTIQINPQINNNLSEGNQAEIKAIATSQLQCQGTFVADTYGVLIGIYRCVPQLDYANVGIDRNLLKTDATDFPNPALDSVGMQTQYRNSFYAPSIMHKWADYSESSLPQADIDMATTYGYLPRYAELKTSFDRVDGAFNSSYKSWVSNIPDRILSDMMYPTSSSLTSEDFRYPFGDILKSDPHYTDNIFVNQSTATTDDDRLLIGSVNLFKVVRPFSVSGLPWAN